MSIPFPICGSDVFREVHPQDTPQRFKLVDVLDEETGDVRIVQKRVVPVSKWSRTIYAKRVWPWNGPEDNHDAPIKLTTYDGDNIYSIHLYKDDENDDGWVRLTVGDYIIEMLDGTHKVVSEEEYKEMNWKEME